MKIRTLASALLLGRLSRAALAQPTTTGMKVVLDTVAVSGKVQQLTLLLPGEQEETHGYPLGAGRRIAVWHRPPTGAHEYDIRSLTLHFSDHSNLTNEGRVQVQLAWPDSSGNPTATYLLPNPFELTARQIRRAKKGVVTLPLQGQHLSLPPQGIFIVLTGLPEPDERFVKDTTLHKGRGFVAATEVQNVRTGRYRFVQSADYINPLIVRTRQEPVSWEGGLRDGQWRRLKASYPNCPSCIIFNYWVDLGVAEL